MKMRLATAGAILLSVGMPLSAHRLDEYLQATTISVEEDRVQGEIRLTPGVAVSPIVLAKIDTNADDVISEAEQRAYAEAVLRDLSLTIDGDRLRLRAGFLKIWRDRGDEGRTRRHSPRVPDGSTPQRGQPDAHFPKSPSQRDFGISCKLPRPGRPEYSDQGTESKLPTVALSIGLRPGRGSVTVAAAIPHIVTADPTLQAPTEYGAILRRV